MIRPLLRFSIVAALLLPAGFIRAQIVTPVPKDQRGRIDAERSGFHDANNIRTVFYNFGMVGDYPADPGNVDLSVFHSVEVPKGSGVNYTDGITPFVLAKVHLTSGDSAYIMETGYRERQETSPFSNITMRFEPRPGFFQPDPAINRGRSPALSNDPRTWPAQWPDKDASWNGTWNGYFGKQPAADQESYTVMDDDYYDKWRTLYFPDSRDATRHGLGLRVDVRGFQWANPQAQDVIFWHYDITNEGTTDYPQPGEPENIIFGLYMDSGIGGSALGCDGVYESDDDNAKFDTTAGLNLVYTWDYFGHGVGLTNRCYPTGYLGYAYLETPGKPDDGVDNDNDGITDEKRDSGPGMLIEGRDAILAYAAAHYDTTKFSRYYGPITQRPAVLAGRWWTGDEDMDWVAENDDTGEDGVWGTHDRGEGDGIPTSGEPHFDKTDKDESDQIGLTGFQLNYINNPGGVPDDIVFFRSGRPPHPDWPKELYDKWSSPNVSTRFDPRQGATNINIGFLFASGPFTLKAGKTERFSLALAYGADLQELRSTVKVVQAIYNANYQFAVPPPTPTVKAEAGDHYVQLTWDDAAEHATDPVVTVNDFEGYRIYRSTDPEFRDPRIIQTGRGTGPIGNGKPIAQFDLKDGRYGYTETTVEGIAYYLGNESGITHTWRDTSVVNGQEYYYAVCSYDYGPTIKLQSQQVFTYYPSENSISVSRTPRGGTILPKNVVAVRPNPKVLGYTYAEASGVNRIEGTGTGAVNVKVLDSRLVPNNHLFKITFNANIDEVHANSYNLIDSTTGEALFRTGDDFNGDGSGISGEGVQPVISTLPTVVVDTVQSGFAAGSATNAKLDVSYSGISMPITLRRTGFPYDMTITFSNAVLDTAEGLFPLPSFRRPVKFRIVAHTPQGDIHLPCKFIDLNGDSTLSANPGNPEVIQVMTGGDSLPSAQRQTWSVKIRNNDISTTRPTLGDVFNIKLLYPFTAGDAFTFNTKAELIESGKAKDAFNTAPYVVPNPYVGAASFEPGLFATSGRGERRVEFRGLPQSCIIRIYTVRGDLVQTLVHNGSTDGFVAWNLRTKDNLDVAPGLYVYHVDAGTLGSHIGKFAIIK
jgi:hypothetical protein